MPSRLAVVIVSLLLATPAVIFWLWLVIQPTSVTIQCPEECECSEEGYIIWCLFPALHNVSFNVPTSARILGIFGNNETYLENDSFFSKGLVELYLLYADYCKIRKIEVGAFNGLTKLLFLSLSDNEISEILPGTFEEISSSLVYLFLDKNRIENLRIDVFGGLVKLQFINLSGNKLHYFHPDTFVRSRKLQGVDLSFNANLAIPTDRNFMNSSSLKQLDISGCNISSVSVETFANASALEWLNVGYSQLRILDVSVLKSLPRLSTLYLYGNPLQCDCQLQEVWRWCQDHNIQTAYKEIVPICDTPSEVKRLSWRVLETVKCLHGNMHYDGDYNNSWYRYPQSVDMVWNTKRKVFTDPVVRLRENISRLSEGYPISVSIFLFIFGTFGNVIVIIMITCNKDMRNVSNMYVLNLAISDMIYLTALFLRALEMRTILTWLSGEIGCALFAFLYRMSVGLTAYSVAVLSVQRYRVTVDPLQFCVSSTWRGTGAIICGVWVMAALSAIPAARSPYLCVGSMLLLLTNFYQILGIFHLLVCCVIPLCVISFCHIMTALHLAKNYCCLPEETKNPLTKTRKNTANIVLGLTFVFVISYVPSHISDIYLYSRFSFENLIGNMIEDIDWYANFLDTNVIVSYFLSINPCLNPVALFCTSRAFRTHLKRYLTCCCKPKSSSADFELTRRN
jgi:hypothetical protein